MIDEGTIGFYDRAAQGFVGLSADGPPEPALARFMARLSPGAAVLDLGCGAGIASAHLAGAGFALTGLDASAGLIEVARRLAPEARFLHAGFDALDETEAYGGVWANFSLLHAPRDEMPRHLAAIARALRPNGLFYLSMLLGTGALRDELTRTYTYYGANELSALLAAAGFEILTSETGEKHGMGAASRPFIAILARRSA